MSTILRFRRVLRGCVLLLLLSANALAADEKLQWSELPSLPNELGVAGPFVGVHTTLEHDVLLVAGGANFPNPVWDSDKRWLDTIHVLEKRGDEYQWHDGGKLPRPVAYGASVSTKDGVVCIGGNDAANVYKDAFLLKWDGAKIQLEQLPELPEPLAFSQATFVGDVVYVACGQTGVSLSSATKKCWSLDLSKRGEASFQWQSLPPLPGKTRALNMVAAQHNGYFNCVYVMGGRRK